MIKKIRYSFLVSNYNKEETISKCIECIISQTYKNFELVIVDDCSSDNSVKIINKFKKENSKIRFFKNRKNEGIGFCRNKLLRRAKGEYIIFVDSDDFIEKNMLEKLNYPVSLGSDLIRFQNMVEPGTPDQAVIEEKQDKFRFCCFERNEQLKENVIVEWCTNPYCANALLWSYCINRNLFFKNKIYFPNIRFHEDFAVMPLLVSYSDSLYVIDDILYHYLQYDKSVTKLKNQEMTFLEKVDFYEQKYNYYKIAVNNIINKIDGSKMREDIKVSVKINLLIRTRERYEKYNMILSKSNKEGLNYEKNRYF